VSFSENIAKFVDFRRTLHSNPELSGCEFQTSGRIEEILRDIGNLQIRKLGSTGLLYEFDSGKKGPSTLIRADIDALPIQEVNTFEYKSRNTGVSHKCGHDGHTSILVGLLHENLEKMIPSGKVYFLFQPAEETGEGAKAVLNEWDSFSEDVDWAFALHNLPGFEMGSVVVRKNLFTAHVATLCIDIRGKTAHAAEPENGIHPGQMLSRVLDFTRQISQTEKGDQNFFLATPVHAVLGENANGISPGHALLKITCRAFSTKVFKQNMEKLETFINETAGNEDLKVTLQYEEEFFSNQNHSDAVAHIFQACKALQIPTQEPAHPFKWGEDFGLFTQNTKGAMFGLGAGLNTPALHNPDYDFPDEIITTGVSVFSQIISQIHST
jgi:amidohydrolase